MRLFLSLLLLLLLFKAMTRFQILNFGMSIPLNHCSLWILRMQLCNHKKSYNLPKLEWNSSETSINHTISFSVVLFCHLPHIPSFFVRQSKCSVLVSFFWSASNSQFKWILPSFYQFTIVYILLRFVRVKRFIIKIDYLKFCTSEMTRCDVLFRLWAFIKSP